MGLFSSKNDTIDDKKWASLQRRARIEEARRKDFLTKKAAEKRKANSKQLRKARWS